MKIQKKNSDAELRSKADKFGQEYTELVAARAEVDTKLVDCKDSIKSFAGKFGEEIGKQKVVTGKHFIVGYTIPDQSPTIDYDRLLKLRPSLENIITVKTVCPEKVAEAVTAGVISRKLLAKCLIPPDPAKAQQRISVTPKDKKNENKKTKDSA
jgi:hypothetical protein